MSDPALPDTDRTVPRHGNPDGDAGHYSGQEADKVGHRVEPRVDAGGVRGGEAAEPRDRRDGGSEAAAIPPEAGHRATVDQRTGAVRGGGVGAGGGQAGEDPDSDSGGSNTG